MAALKFDCVPFSKLIECTECNEPMYKRNIYIRPDGTSICSHCFVDKTNNKCQLRCLFDLWKSYYLRVFIHRCNCGKYCVTRNRVLEDIIAQCSKSHNNDQKMNLFNASNWSQLHIVSFRMNCYPFSFIFKTSTP